MQYTESMKAHMSHHAHFPQIRYKINLGNKHLKRSKLQTEVTLELKEFHKQTMQTVKKLNKYVKKMVER